MPIVDVSLNHLPEILLTWDAFPLGYLATHIQATRNTLTLPLNAGAFTALLHGTTSKRVNANLQKSSPHRKRFITWALADDRRWTITDSRSILHGSYTHFWPKRGTTAHQINRPNRAVTARAAGHLHKQPLLFPSNERFQ